ncbi:MAG: OadG family protein [Bacteroidaceae bacterium]|nr:OadG family protein [Bacteroidaceae bacterium]
MKRILSLVSLLALATAGALAQGAHDFRINEVFVLGCPKCCPSDIVDRQECQKKPSFYLDEYGEPASWIEIENTSYTTHEIRNCFIATDRAVLNKELSAPEREQLMSIIPAGDPRTLISGKQRITFFVGNRNRGTLHTTCAVQLQAGQTNWIALYDGNAVDLLDSITVPALEPGQTWARLSDGTWQVCNATEATPNGPNQEYHNDKIREFKEKDPHGFAMTLMCMAVVFTCLAILFLFFQGFGLIIAKMVGKVAKPVVSPVVVAGERVVEAAKQGTTETKGIPMETYTAVIGLALHEYFGGTHDIESGVLTISPSQHSSWADKSHELRQTPIHHIAE